MAENDKISQWSLTLLRVVLGIIFLYHGYVKLFVPGAFVGTVGLFTKIGIFLPKISALVVSVVEFAGGILLILGLLTRWTTLLLIIEMVVALFTLHLRNGFLVSNGGYEFVLLILAALVVIISSGAGKLSVGKKYFKNKHLL